MNSVDRAGLNAGTSAATLPAFLLGVILAAMLGDIEIVAWVLLAHVAVSLRDPDGGGRPWLEVPVREQWRAVRPVLFGCAVAWAAARAVSDTLTWAAPLTLIAALAAGAGAYLAVISIVEPGVVGRSIAQLRRTLQRRGAAAEGCGRRGRRRRAAAAGRLGRAGSRRHGRGRGHTGWWRKAPKPWTSSTRTTHTSLPERGTEESRSRRQRGRRRAASAGTSARQQAAGPRPPGRPRCSARSSS